MNRTYATDNEDGSRFRVFQNGVGDPEDLKDIFEEAEDSPYDLHIEIPNTAALQTSEGAGEWMKPVDGSWTVQEKPTLWVIYTDAEFGRSYTLEEEKMDAGDEETLSLVRSKDPRLTRDRRRKAGEGRFRTLLLQRLAEASKELEDAHESPDEVAQNDAFYDRMADIFDVFGLAVTEFGSSLAELKNRSKTLREKYGEYGYDCALQS